MSTKFKLRLETGRLMWQASIFYFHVLNVFWLYCVILFSLIMRGQTDIKHSQSKKKNICRYIQYLDVIKQCHVSVTWRKQVLWTKEFKAKKKKKFQDILLRLISFFLQHICSHNNLLSVVNISQDGKCSDSFILQVWFAAQCPAGAEQPGQSAEKFRGVKPTWCEMTHARRQRQKYACRVHNTRRFIITIFFLNQPPWTQQTSC